MLVVSTLILIFLPFQFFLQPKIVFADTSVEQLFNVQNTYLNTLFAFMCGMTIVHVFEAMWFRYHRKPNGPLMMSRRPWGQRP